MTSFSDMAGESEGVFMIPIVLFTLALISGTFFIVAWLNRNSKENAKDINKLQAKGMMPIKDFVIICVSCVLRIRERGVEKK